MESKISYRLIIPNGAVNVLTFDNEAAAYKTYKTLSAAGHSSIDVHMVEELRLGAEQTSILTKEFKTRLKKQSENIQ